MPDSARRQRVLLITRNLPPLVGGMERLNWHMAEELARSFDVRVIGPEGSAAVAPSGIAFREAPLRPLWKFLVCARALARREARAWKPDIVLAGSGLTAPLARSAARACRAKCVVYVHGLDVAVKHPVYRAIWLPAIRRMDRIIANSRATAELCRRIGVDPARIGIVHPGVDLPEETIPLNPPSQAKGEAKNHAPFDTKGVAPKERGDASSFTPFDTKGADAQRRGDESSITPFGTKGVAPKERGDEAFASANTSGFRARHDLGRRPLLLSVGRLSARKGLREFVTHALPQIVAARPDAMLLIVGDAPKDALHAAAQSPDSIRAAAADAGVADNLRFLGKLSDIELDAAFRAADVHVFPVREIPGDPEGFGMVAIEAAARGLPTVAFASGGVPDAVVEGETGSLVPPGDYEGFAANVDAWLARNDRATVAQRCAVAAESFSWRHFGEALRRQLAAPEVGD